VAPHSAGKPRHEAATRPAFEPIRGRPSAVHPEIGWCGTARWRIMHPMQTPRLITIGFSHYCEKVRWALDRAGMAFDEERHPPALHYRALRGLGAGRQVPVLVHAGGALGDSTAILKWIDAQTPADRRLYPADPALRAEVEQWEDRFDEVLGPHARRPVYYYGLRTPKIMRWTATRGVGWPERVMLRLMLPFAGGFFGRKLGLSAAEVAESQAQVRGVLDAVAEHLADGRRFLVGDAFTAADLTLASLAAPVYLPAGYGAPLPPLDQLHPEYQAWVNGLADHPAVAFSKRMYAEERT